MAIEAVIFDWGGTLSEFVPAEMVDAWRLVARHLAPEREDELTARLVAAEEAFWATTATHQRSSTLADLLAAVAADVGLDVAEALLDEAAVRHLDAWTPHVRHDPDAVGVLEELKGRGASIGLLSNTHWPPSFHERFLQRDGLAALIDARLYTSAMEFQKPHPSAFRAALAALGVDDASRAVFVGDRPWDDVGGAKAAGMRAVLRRNPLVLAHDAVEADGVITSLPELLEVLDGW
jgi:putative hydrolase of the HAD superfamily